MLENMSRRNRSLLSLSLTSLALTLSVSAFCTSYWCEGTHKVVKPLCLSPVKMKNCGQNNSQPYTTGEGGTYCQQKVFPKSYIFSMAGAGDCIRCDIIKQMRKKPMIFVDLQTGISRLKLGLKLVEKGKIFRHLDYKEPLFEQHLNVDISTCN